MLLYALGAALAAPTPTVPFTPPAKVHLGVRDALVESRAAESGDACDAAVAAALTDMQANAKKAELPTMVSVTLQADDGEACKQRRTGDTVLQSVVHLDGMAIAEDPSLPEVAVDRAVTVLATLGAASGGLDAVRLAPIDGAAWWELATGPLDPEGSEGEGDPIERASALLVNEVFPSLGDRAGLLATVPEVAGIARTFEAGKKKTYRALRVRIPSSVAADYVRGALTEEGLVEGVVMETCIGLDPWTIRDASSLELGDSGGLRVELRDVDMNDADLEGLEDEEDGAE